MSNVRTDVEVEGRTALDKIHFERMNDAFAKFIFDLFQLRDVRVNHILNRWNITLLPGLRTGIEYADGAKQILEVDLRETKAQLAELAAIRTKTWEAANRPKPKNRRKRK